MFEKTQNKKDVLSESVIAPDIKVSTSTPTQTPTFTPFPTRILISPTKTPIIIKKTIIISDKTSPTPLQNEFANTVNRQREIFDALNSYRQKRGAGALSWNDNLYGFAQSRAELFSVQGKMDNHAGFTDFITNQNGLSKMGFTYMGENALYGYGVISAVDIIEKYFAHDGPHDQNQLDSSWTHAGVGVSGAAVDVIFGK